MDFLAQAYNLPPFHSQAAGDHIWICILKTLIVILQLSEAKIKKKKTGSWQKTKHHLPTGSQVTNNPGQNLSSYLESSAAWNMKGWIEMHNFTPFFWSRKPSDTENDETLRLKGKLLIESSTWNCHCDPLLLQPRVHARSPFQGPMEGLQPRRTLTFTSRDQYVSLLIEVLHVSAAWWCKKQGGKKWSCVDFRLSWFWV